MDRSAAERFHEPACRVGMASARRTWLNFLPVTLVVALALSTAYVLTRRSDATSVLPSQRIAVLEQANARGFIDEYEVALYSSPYGKSEYVADDAVRLVFHRDRFGPYWYSLSYPGDESAKASAIARLARRTRAKVVVSPPYTT